MGVYFNTHLPGCFLSSFWRSKFAFLLKKDPCGYKLFQLRQVLTRGGKICPTSYSVSVNGIKIHLKDVPARTDLWFL
jgi:hypothetical protein